MKMFSVAVMSAAVLTGVAGAGVAYEIASTGDSAAASSTSSTSPATTTAPAAAKPKKRFAPCEPPAVRHGKVCVIDVVRTVLLPAASERAGGVSGRSSSGDDGLLHDAFDDHGDDFDDDHDEFDDHGGDRDDDVDDDDFDDDHDGDDDGDDDDDHDSDDD